MGLPVKLVPNPIHDPRSVPSSAITAGTSASRTARTGAPTETLAELIGQMAEGSQDALSRLFDQTANMLNGLLMRILEVPQDAEEVLLDVYMKAWRNARTYSPERGSVQGWLFTIARSVAIDRVRQRRTRPDTICLQLDAAEPWCVSDSPEMQSVALQRRTRVAELLRQLPSEQRDALAMAFFGGLSHVELAERLGQPLGTVKSRIRMGLMKLRTLLKESPLV